MFKFFVFFTVFLRIVAIFSGIHTVKEIMLATDRGFSQGLTFFG
jgi:hypothetical protein